MLLFKKKYAYGSRIRPAKDHLSKAITEQHVLYARCETITGTIQAEKHRQEQEIQIVEEKQPRIMQFIQSRVAKLSLMERESKF